MTTTSDAANADLVRRMQECFNSRQFDGAAGLFTSDYFSHPLGSTGFEAGRDVWEKVVARFPAMRVIAEDVLVDGDKVVVRSSVEGMTPEGDPLPTMIEIFRVQDGRLAEMWGVSEGPQKSVLDQGRTISPQTSE
ncbi:ester cyclase [Flindersiella endophytica]